MALKLEVRGIGKDFLIPVIDSVSFRVEAGEFVCLLGPNGCGKTTLLRIVGGIEPASRGRGAPRRPARCRPIGATSGTWGSSSRRTASCPGSRCATT